MASESGSTAEAPLYGVSAEFLTPDALVRAVAQLSPYDFGRIDTFSPAPVPGMARYVRAPTWVMRVAALAGVVVGGGAFMAMCLYATGWDIHFRHRRAPTLPAGSLS